MECMFDMTEWTRHSGSQPVSGKVYEQDFEFRPERCDLARKYPVVLGHPVHHDHPWRISLRRLNHFAASRTINRIGHSLCSIWERGWPKNARDCNQLTSAGAGLSALKSSMYRAILTLIQINDRIAKEDSHSIVHDRRRTAMARQHDTVWNVIQETGPRSAWVALAL